MKPLLAIACLLAAQSLPAASPEAADGGIFSLIGPDFKKPEQVPDSFFNPFRVQAADTGLQKKDTAAITNETIIQAVGHRSVSGILYGSEAKANRIIIGDQVFEAGDELVFPGESDQTVPLVKGARVFLRAIGANSLALEVAPEGESAREVTFPLRAFWGR